MKKKVALLVVVSICLVMVLLFSALHFTGYFEPQATIKPNVIDGRGPTKYTHTFSVTTGDTFIIAQKIRIPYNVVSIHLVDITEVSTGGTGGLSSTILGISSYKSDDPNYWLFNYYKSPVDIFGGSYQIGTSVVHPYLGQTVTPGNEYYLMTKFAFRYSRTVTISATDAYTDGGIHLCKNGVWSTKSGNIKFTIQGYVEEPTYTLTIKTIPSNCEVSVAGVGTKSSGTSGAMFYDLSEGTYSFTVSKSGYASKTQSVTIGTSDVTRAITLQQSSRKLTIITTPSNCEVTVQNVGTKDSGTSGAVFDVTSGTYAVTAYKEGYNTVTESITVGTSDVTRTINLASHKYDLTVFTIPGDCTVTVDGAGTQNSGSTGAVFVNLESGTYTVTVSKTDYVSDTVLVTITNADAVKTVTLVPIDGNGGNGGNGDNGDNGGNGDDDFEIDTTILLVIIIIAIACVVFGVLVWKGKKRKIK